MEQIEGDIGSTSWWTEVSSSIDCLLVIMWDVVERNDGADAGGTTDGVDSVSVRAEPSPPLGCLAMDRPDLIRSMGGNVTGGCSSAVCIGGIAG